MKGYQLTFFTQEDHFHKTTQLSEWLLLAARDLGLRGATIVSGSEGYGQHRHIHYAHFFRLALSDRPQEIVMVATEEESNLLFDHLQKEGVHLFYAKTPVEFGILGKPS
jgi:PII-like signaling protein